MSVQSWRPLLLMINTAHKRISMNKWLVCLKMSLEIFKHGVGQNTNPAESETGKQAESLCSDWDAEQQFSRNSWLTDSPTFLLNNSYVWVWVRKRDREKARVQGSSICGLCQVRAHTDSHTDSQLHACLDPYSHTLHTDTWNKLGKTNIKPPYYRLFKAALNQCFILITNQMNPQRINSQLCSVFAYFSLLIWF